MKNISLWAAGLTALVGSSIGLLASAASSVVTIPTSTPTDVLGYVAGQISDPGTLAIIELVIAIPLVFYVAHLVIGLFPKSRSRRGM